jgi:hypothetical protein
MNKIGLKNRFNSLRNAIWNYDYVTIQNPEKLNGLHYHLNQIEQIVNDLESESKIPLIDDNDSFKDIF